VVCEGIPDALIAAQAGYRAVGLLGAHTPDEGVAARLANHADHHHLDVVVVSDPDVAGGHSASLLTHHLDTVGVDALVITPPGGNDLNAWALADPDWAERFDERVTPVGASVGVDE
jgi:hypothetical protein